MRAIVKGKISVHPEEAIKYLIEVDQDAKNKKYSPVKLPDDKDNDGKNGEVALADEDKKRTILPTTRLENSLLTFLKDNGWIPKVQEDADVLIRAQSTILKTVKNDHQDLVKETYLATIIHSPTHSWGIVSLPVDDGIDFRLKQPIAQKLVGACEKLVEDFSDKRIPFTYYVDQQDGENSEKVRKDGYFQVEFLSPIEVLEPGSEHQAFVGKIIGKPWKATLKEKKNQVWIAGIASALAIILFFLTFPKIWGFLAHPGEVLASEILKECSNSTSIILESCTDSMASLTPENEWLQGMLDRLSTTAIFTAVLNWIEIILHNREIRRTKRIMWATIASDRVPGI